VRSKVVFRPGAGGLNTDLPSTILKPDAFVYANNVVLYNGILRQRWGWKYHGSYSVIAATSGFSAGYSIFRAKFTKAASAGTVTIAFTDQRIYRDTPAGIFSVPTPDDALSVYPSARCQYRDEVIICASDGQSPVLRYSGAPVGNLYRGTITTLTVFVPTMVQNESRFTFTGGSWSGTAPPVSAYFSTMRIGRECVKVAPRIVAAGATEFTVEDGVCLGAGFTHTDTIKLNEISNRIFPCQEDYADGTCDVTVAGTGATITATGYGTKWITYVSTVNRALIYKDNASNTYKMRDIDSVPSDVSMTLHPAGAAAGYANATTTKAPYKIVCSPTWTDACVHKGSLCGTGAYKFPNRVYLAPPNWNPAYPPSATYPFDYSTDLSNASYDGWILDFIDVPSSNDGDPCVALLSTQGPLLVLKRSSVYAIHGTFPNYELSLVSSGNGCISRDSAVSVDGQQFWAGEYGVYTYRGGRVVDLTAGAISREWQGLMQGWQSGSTCAVGVIAGHLVVSVRGLDSTKTAAAKSGPDAANPTSRTYLYDIGNSVWVSRLSNVSAPQLHSARIGGEPAKLLFYEQDNASGKSCDLAPALNGSTTSLTDESHAVGGTTAEVWSPTNLAGAAGVDGEARLVDLSTVTRAYDSASSTASTITVKVELTGGLRPETSGVVATLGTIASNGISIDTTQRSRFRVGRSGRTHQLRFSLAPGASTTQVLEVQEAVLNFRDSRGRS
jgi:hypothetical protein